MPEQSFSYKGGAVGIWRKLALNDLYFFSRAVLDYTDLSPVLHGDICRWLMGLTNRTALLCIPRSFFKSTLTSIAYPLWRAVKNPDIRILITSKSAALASKSIDEIRGIVDGNEFFRLLFPDLLPNTKLKTARWSSACASLKRPREWKEGTFEAAGAGSRIVGRHYHIIIEDDPIYPDYDKMTGTMSEPSDEDVQKAIGWHDLRNPLAIKWQDLLTLVVGTRWKRYDFINHVVNNTADLKVFSRAAIENGESIFPERFPLETLEEMRAEMSRYVWATQYMNQPIAEEDIVFREEWIRTFDTAPKQLKKVICVDPAVSLDRKACKSAMVCVGIAENNRRYVLDTYARRVGGPELVQDMFRFIKKNFKKEDTKRVGIEQVSYQKTLAQFVREEMHKQDYYFSIQELQSGRKKDAKDHRIQALVPYVENGALFLRSHQHELRNQLIDYPGPQRDLVDALAYHLQMIRAKFSTPKPKEDNNPFLIDNILTELREQGRVGNMLYGSKSHIVEDEADLASI